MGNEGLTTIPGFERFVYLFAPTLAINSVSAVTLTKRRRAKHVSHDNSINLPSTSWPDIPPSLAKHWHHTKCADCSWLCCASPVPLNLHVTSRWLHPLSPSFWPHASILTPSPVRTLKASCPQQHHPPWTGCITTSSKSSLWAPFLGIGSPSFLAWLLAPPMQHQQALRKSINPSSHSEVTCGNVNSLILCAYIIDYIVSIPASYSNFDFFLYF